MQASPPATIAESKQQIAKQNLIRTPPHFDLLPAQDSLSLGLSIGSDLEFGSPVSFDSFPMSFFPFPERTVLKQEQIDFCIDQFKTCIPQLVQQNRSPFIHRDSYQRMPPVAYQDLLGISAMYAQKTPQNQTIIFLTLDYRIASLLQSARSSMWSTQDYLVGVQVLIIYQIIRLFDGDVRQRANAEKHLELLQSWTIKLHGASNTFYHDGRTESPYERWVFIESARRTVITSIMVQAMYSLLKDGYCTSVPLLETLPVSADGSLWNASEETWWQDTLGFGGELITYGELTNQWNGGHAFHMDTYEAILIEACRHKLISPPPILS